MHHRALILGLPGGVLKGKEAEEGRKEEEEEES